MSGGDWKQMFKAIQENDYELVSYYLKMGIDPNYQHPEYMAAPLIESIRYGNYEITKLLLDNAADPLIKEVIDGDTPMMIAQLHNKQKAIDLLNEYIK